MFMTASTTTHSYRYSHSSANPFLKHVSLCCLCIYECAGAIEFYPLSIYEINNCYTETSGRVYHNDSTHTRDQLIPIPCSQSL